MKLKKLNNAINYKDLIVKAKIFNVKGSSPNTIDDIILISNDTIFGTIGGGNLEYLIINEAKILSQPNVPKETQGKRSGYRVILQLLAVILHLILSKTVYEKYTRLKIVILVMLQK